MSESSHLHTIRLPLRKICTAVPAVALISGGIMLPASVAPTIASAVAPASASSPAVVVPETPLAQPGSPQNLDDPMKWRLPKAGTAQAVASMLPAGIAPGSSAPVTLDTAGIPVRAIEAYRQAATLTNAADPTCHLDWPLLGAIGRVESNHAQFGGNQLDATGVARPGIIGIALDGSKGIARITDTDHGVLDRDTTFDRAVGPMQFIPGTWRVAGVDANHDGVKDPQNMADAAAATAVYLCSGPGDLTRPADLHSAILRYNPSDSYVSMVIAIADAYRHGVKALPASVVAPVSPTTAAARTSAAATSRAKLTSGKPAAGRPAAAKATTASKPGSTSQAPATSVPAVTQVPSSTPPGAPQPTPSTSTPSQPAPTTICVPVPSATSTTSTSTPSGAASPTPTQTCLPPCPATASGGSSTASPTSSAASPAPALTCLPPCVPAAAGTQVAGPAASALPAEPCLPPAAAAPTPSTTATP
jgi:hypothetical protein